jgi:hypothetical protein
MTRTFAFALLILVALGVACGGATTGQPPGGTSGIQGTVLLGPLCPVQRVGSPCPDEPIAADISVTDPSGKLAATGRSGPDGGYRISLSPGTYVVTAKRSGSNFQAAKPVTVRVAAGAFTPLDIEVDSGIR